MGKKLNNNTAVDGQNSDKPAEPRRKNPIPNNKPFSSTYQPDPKNVSKGLRERNARLVIQRELEATLEEMLKDPMTDTLKLTNFIKLRLKKT